MRELAARDLGRPGAPPRDAGEPLPRGRDRRREGGPHPLERQRAALLRGARVLRRSRPGSEGRAHVALRGGRERGDRRGDPQRGLQGRDAGHPHRRARPRPPGGQPRRGDDRGALPGAQADPRLGSADAGDLHAARLGRRVRARNASAGRRRGPGHDRLPVRSGARDRPRPRAACGRRLHRRRDRARVRARAGGHAQPARHRHALHRLPRDLRRGRRGRPACCGSWSRR